MVWPSNNAGGEIDYLLVSPIDVPAQVADDLIRRRRRPPIPSDPAAWEGTYVSDRRPGVAQCVESVAGTVGVSHRAATYAVPRLPTASDSARGKALFLGRPRLMVGVV
jgi:hypothetical protein